MRLAFLLYHYFPYGGLQRDCRCLVEELLHRGHHCRVYCMSWQGETIPGADVRRMPATALSQHRRNQRFLTGVRADLAKDPVDGIIGFNTMPDLDIYFAADACYLDICLNERGRLYRRSARFRQGVDWERAVFAPDSETQILLLSASERDKFAQHYQTPPQRMHLLPPGVTPDRRAPPDAPERRKAVRASLGVEPRELVLLFVSSDFESRGLERAITALAHTREAQPSVTTRLLVVGRDKVRHYRRLAQRLGVADGVEFLGGRGDVAELMLSADVLIHPARREAAGVVLLEALAAGLPVITTDVCGYAHHVKAARAGILLPSPFSQEQLDRAVMRYMDGVFRAECRNSALLYARLTDLYSMHRLAVELIENVLSKKSGVVAGRHS
ncbi:MAG TPA: glycosyltransferase family 4 protein [Halioglobus sp.]